jgi:hypothetical protein
MIHMVFSLKGDFLTVRQEDFDLNSYKVIKGVIRVIYWIDVCPLLDFTLKKKLLAFSVSRSHDT